MKEFKGTPGPWYWDEEGLGNKTHIVFGKEYPAEMTSKTNKAIIAAAPELLEALIKLVDIVDDMTHGPSTDAAHAAIHKALGE